MGITNRNTTAREEPKSQRLKQDSAPKESMPKEKFQEPLLKNQKGIQQEIGVLDELNPPQKQSIRLQKIIIDIYKTGKNNQECGGQTKIVPSSII